MHIATLNCIIFYSLIKVMMLLRGMYAAFFFWLQIHEILFSFTWLITLHIVLQKQLYHQVDNAKISLYDTIFRLLPIPFFNLRG